MRNFLKTSLLLASPFLFLGVNTFADTNQDIALQYFPANLKASVTTEFGKTKSFNLTKYVSVVPADLDNTGKQSYLVCVYNDRVDGALRVIKTDGPQPVLVAEAPSDLLSGVWGGATLVDLNNDKKPEIVVKFMAPRGNESTWIFSWNGSALNLISPMAQDRTVLGSVTFMDLSGNGSLSVVTQDPIRPTRDESGKLLLDPTRTYTLTNGSLSLTNTFYYQNTFSRASGTPQDQTDTISIADTSKSYFLKVYDLNMSNPDTGPLTSSATVSLNGKQIIGPSDFNPGKRTKVISRSIQIQSSNKLTVKIAGAPGSKILVTVSQSQ